MDVVKDMKVVGVTEEDTEDRVMQIIHYDYP